MIAVLEDLTHIQVQFCYSIERHNPELNNPGSWRYCGRLVWRHRWPKGPTRQNGKRFISKVNCGRLSCFVHLHFHHFHPHHCTPSTHFSLPVANRDNPLCIALHCIPLHLIALHSIAQIDAVPTPEKPLLANTLSVAKVCPKLNFPNMFKHNLFWPGSWFPLRRHAAAKIVANCLFLLNLGN